MTKQDLLLNFIENKGKVSTGELCRWKGENKYDRAQRTCRNFQNKILCRKMTEEEKKIYQPTGHANYVYEWIGDKEPKPTFEIEKTGQYNYV